MRLAANYSEALLTLLDKTPDLPIDYLKVPLASFPECRMQFQEGKKYRPLLLHLTQPGILDLLNPKTSEQMNATVLEEILTEIQTPHLSTHTSARLDYFPEYTAYHHRFNLNLKNDIAKRFKEGLEIYRDHFQVPLLIENFPYYPIGKEYRICSEPEFISELCESNNCLFLLDISHARVTAHFLKMDIYKYLELLPVARIKEIHLSGTERHKEGFYWDAHTELDELDYEILDFILKQVTPEILTIEYGGQSDYQLDLDGSYIKVDRNSPEKLAKMILRLRAQTTINYKGVN